MDMQALVPTQMSSRYFEQISITALGVLADCILVVDFLDEFQVLITINEKQMYTKDENGGRQHKFVSEKKVG
jgi:hypothetical protein